MCLNFGTAEFCPLPRRRALSLPSQLVCCTDVLDNLGQKLTPGAQPQRALQRAWLSHSASDVGRDLGLELSVQGGLDVPSHAAELTCLETRKDNWHSDLESSATPLFSSSGFTSAHSPEPCSHVGRGDRFSPVHRGLATEAMTLGNGGGTPWESLRSWWTEQSRASLPPTFIRL